VCCCGMRCGQRYSELVGFVVPTLLSWWVAVASKALEIRPTIVAVNLLRVGYLCGAPILRRSVLLGFSTLHGFARRTTATVCLCKTGARFKEMRFSHFELASCGE